MIQKYIVTINTPGGIKGFERVGAGRVKSILRQALCYDEDCWANGRTINVKIVEEKED